MADIEKNLGGLAERINAEHRACETAVNSALTHAMNAGGMLSEAKASLPHGAFGPWLEENFAGSDRTARAYMRVHAHRDELEEKRQSSATLSLDGALKALSAPKDASGRLRASPDPGNHPGSFEGFMEFTAALIEIRDSGAWRESGHDSFERYLEARWGIEPALLSTAEEAMNNPVEKVRAMLLWELFHLIPGIKFTDVGLENIPEDLPYETWEKGLRILASLAATVPPD